MQDPRSPALPDPKPRPPSPNKDPEEEEWVGLVVSSHTRVGPYLGEPSVEGRAGC